METQTPLAIISAKIEMLMQENNYSEKQQELLSEAYGAIQRFKKLNETLITLSRIENNQFTETEKIDFSIAIKDKIEELSDFFEERKITFRLDLQTVQEKINPILLSILLNNLITNSIKYNLPKNGFIEIILNEQYLSIRNSSLLKEIDQKHLFERFKSYSTNKDSIGLGLSIIKKITDTLNWNIQYSYKNSIHEFRIYWLE